MKLRPRGRQLAVAAIVVITVAAAVTLVRHDDSGSKAIDGYCAMMPDAIGLYVGNEVTEMGYTIGTITSISPQPDAVRVTFSLNAGRDVAANVVAVTRSKSVLADRSLELTQRDTPTVSRLTPGTCVSQDNAYTPKSISEVAGSAADLLKQIAPDGDTETLQNALENLSRNVSGIGPDAASLLRTASAAADSPEQIVSDIGTIIVTMAPLTSTALAHWTDIQSMATKLPDASVVASTKLWPGAAAMVEGLIPLIGAINDVQTRYGQYIWPAADLVADGIHIAATRVPEIQSALRLLPTMATAASLMTRPGNGAGLRAAPPYASVSVPHPAALCSQINSAGPGLCRTNEQTPGTVLIRLDALASIGGLQ